MGNLWDYFVFTAGGLGLAGSVALVVRDGALTYSPVTFTPTTAQVISGPEPETYVEWNGVRCYLRIDGKDISDLVCE